jgi:hypothetical protein
MNEYNPFLLIEHITHPHMHRHNDALQYKLVSLKRRILDSKCIVEAIDLIGLETNDLNNPDLGSISDNVAPPIGLEPMTDWLTASRST